MLAAMPDLSPALRTATPEALADIFDAFNVKVVFDKANRKLTLAATLTSELVAENEKPRRPGGRSGNSSIAGAGCVRISPQPRLPVRGGAGGSRS